MADTKVRLVFNAENVDETLNAIARVQENLARLGEGVQGSSGPAGSSAGGAPDMPSGSVYASQTAGNMVFSALGSGPQQSAPVSYADQISQAVLQHERMISNGAQATVNQLLGAGGAGGGGSGVPHGGSGSVEESVLREATQDIVRAAASFEAAALRIEQAANLFSSMGAREGSGYTAPPAGSSPSAGAPDGVPDTARPGAPPPSPVPADPAERNPGANTATVQDMQGRPGEPPPATPNEGARQGGESRRVYMGRMGWWAAQSVLAAVGEAGSYISQRRVMEESGQYISPEDWEKYELGKWRHVAGGAGAVIGGALGFAFGGGPFGMVVGASIGNWAGRTVAGWILAPKEAELDREKALAELGLMTGQSAGQTGLWGQNRVQQLQALFGEEGVLPVADALPSIYGVTGPLGHNGGQPWMAAANIWARWPRPQAFQRSVSATVAGAQDPWNYHWRNYLRSGAFQEPFEYGFGVDALIAAGNADFSTLSGMGAIGQIPGNIWIEAERAAGGMRRSQLSGVSSERWGLQAAWGQALGQSPITTAGQTRNQAELARRATAQAAEYKLRAARMALQEAMRSGQRSAIEKARFAYEHALAEAEAGYGQAAGTEQQASVMETNELMQEATLPVTLGSISQSYMTMLDIDPLTAFDEEYEGRRRRRRRADQIVMGMQAGGQWSNLPLETRRGMLAQQRETHFQEAAVPIRAAQFGFSRLSAGLGVFESAASAQMGSAQFFAESPREEYQILRAASGLRLSATTEQIERLVRLGAAPEQIFPLLMQQAALTEQIRQFPMQEAHAAYSIEMRSRQADESVAASRLSLVSARGGWGSALTGPSQDVARAAVASALSTRAYASEVEGLYRSGQASWTQVQEARARVMASESQVFGARVAAIQDPSLSAISGLGVIAGGFGAAASTALSGGFGTAGAFGAQVGQEQAMATQAAVAQQLAQTWQAVAPGSTYAMQAAAQAAAHQQALMAQHVQMAQFDPGSEYRMRQQGLGFRLEAATRTFTGYGEVRSMFSGMMGMARERLMGIRAHRQRLAEEGVDDPAVMERLQQQELEAGREFLGAQEALEHGWQERLVSQAFGMRGSWSMVAREFDPIRSVFQFGVRNRFFGGRGSDMEMYRLRGALYSNTFAGNPADPTSAAASALGGRPQGRGWSMFDVASGLGGEPATASELGDAAGKLNNASTSLEQVVRQLQAILTAAQTGPNANLLQVEQATNTQASLNTARPGMGR